MKKLFFSILLLSLILTLAACKGTAENPADTTDASGSSTVTDTKEVSETETEKADTPTAPTQYTLTFEDGTRVVLGGSAADALSALGTYDEVMEAPNCTNPDYFDRVYTYGASYKLTTTPTADGTEYVSQIEMLSDLVAWDVNGTLLMIGSSASELDSALGTPSEDNFGVRKYVLEGAVATVVIDGGSISSLTVSCS